MLRIALWSLPNSVKTSTSSRFWTAVATYAAEMFVQKLAQDGLVVAKKRGRHTVRYEDIAEARANDHNLNFLDILFP